MWHTVIFYFTVFFSVLWSHFSGAYKHPSLCWMSVVVVLSSEKRKSSLHFIFSPSLIVIRCEKHCDAALQMTFPSKTELTFQATTTTITNHHQWKTVVHSRPGWQSAKGQQIMSLHDDDIDDSKILAHNMQQRERQGWERPRDCIMWQWWCAWPIFTKYCIVMTSYRNSYRYTHTVKISWTPKLRWKLSFFVNCRPFPMFW